MNVRAIGVAVAVVFAMACKTSGSQSQGTGGSAQAPSADTQGTTASGTHGAAGQDPLSVPGPEIKAHASDQIVSGEIGQVSESSLTIASDLGDTKVLEIAPETSITVDGQDATAAELEEGQPVRASYNQVEGRDVAVAVEVGAPSPSELGEPGSPPESTSSPGESPGSSGSSGTGSSGSVTQPSEPGTAGEPTSPHPRW